MRPEFLSMSCEFQALAKMIGEELANSTLPSSLVAANAHFSPLFERGRFYDEYSARRNERLKRKKGEIEEVRTSAVLDPGVLAAQLGKRRNAKKTEAVRKSVPANFSVGRREGLRSSTRISKENKKPIGSGNINEKSSSAAAAVVDGAPKRIGTRAARRS
ncbi:hypothetical protein ACLOJK_018311 [Asimina triloba]